MDNDTEKKIEQKEQKKSTPPDKGVDVSEEFQQAAHKLTHKATKAHLGHLRNKINDREDELRDEEMADKGKDGKMSMDSAPSSVGD